MGLGEAGEREVAEDKHHASGEEEPGVVAVRSGGGVEGRAQLPGGDGGDEGKERKEDAGELKPQDAGEPDGWTPYSAAEPPAALSDATGGGGSLLRP